MSGTASSFMRLPKEIRLKVYESLLLPVHEEPILLRWPPPAGSADLERIDPPLLRVNSVVCAEAQEIYYSGNIFLCSSIHSPNLRALAMRAGTSVRRICVKTSANPFAHDVSGKLALFVSQFPRLDLLVFDVQWWATKHDLQLVLPTVLKNNNQWQCVSKIELWATGRELRHDELAWGTAGRAQPCAKRDHGFTVRFLYRQRDTCHIDLVTQSNQGWAARANVHEECGVRDLNRRPSRVTWTRTCIQ